MKINDWLDDLEDHPDTLGRQVLLALLTPPLLLRSLVLGLVFAAAEAWPERKPRAPARKVRVLGVELDARFWAVVRVAWAPYLLAMACLVWIWVEKSA